MRDWSKNCTRLINATSLDEIAARVEILQQDYPEDPEYAGQYGQILAVSGKWPEAAAVLEDAVRKLGGYSDLHGLTALALCRAGRELDAVNVLLQTGQPYGYYLADAAMHLINTLDLSGETTSAKDFANALLKSAAHFPHRHHIEQWIKNH